MKILVCEDEPEVAAFIQDALNEVGYDVELVGSGIDALDRLSTSSYDAAILDLMLPGLDGLSVLRQVRAEGIRTPILILSAKFKVDERIEGLDAGANDYLVKPFALGELLARVRVLLRQASESVAPIDCCGVHLDPTSRRVTYRDRVVFLSSTEFALLHYLMENHGRIVTRSQILSHVWDDEGFRGSNVVDVYVNYLRNKLDPQLIETVRGAGYVMGPHAD